MYIRFKKKQTKKTCFWQSTDSNDMDFAWSESWLLTKQCLWWGKYNQNNSEQFLSITNFPFPVISIGIFTCGQPRTHGHATSVVRVEVSSGLWLFMHDFWSKHATMQVISMHWTSTISYLFIWNTVRASPLQPKSKPWLMSPTQFAVWKSMYKMSSFFFFFFLM